MELFLDNYVFPREIFWKNVWLYQKYEKVCALHNFLYLLPLFLNTDFSLELFQKNLDESNTNF